MRTLRIPLLLAAFLACPRPALADAPAATTDDTRKEADILFHEGIALYTNAKYLEAEAKLLGAWQLAHTYDIAANLGHTEYHLLKYADAAGYLAFAIKNWPLAGQQGPRELAQKRFEEVRPEVGAITVHVDTPGADIVVDGKPVGHSPLDSSLFVTPGLHDIQVSLGSRSAKQSVDVPKGGASDVTLKLDRSPIPAVVGGILAAAGIGAGIAFFAVAGSKATTLQNSAASLRAEGGACSPARPSSFQGQCSDIDATRSSHNTFVTAGGVSLAVGGAALAVTAGYLFWPSAKPHATTGSAVRFGPILDGSTRGAFVVGSF